MARTLGVKTGVQIELAIAYLRSFLPQLKVWGISATLGNKELAREILLGPIENYTTVEAPKINKKIKVKSILPKSMESFPLAGTFGLAPPSPSLKIGAEKTRPPSSLPTPRAQCEIWFHRLPEADPNLAGNIAMHHGSIDKKIRLWVEDALREEQLKVVVCTSSLDLGVDFSPVETVFKWEVPKELVDLFNVQDAVGTDPKQGVPFTFSYPCYGTHRIGGPATRDRKPANRRPYSLPQRL